MDVQAIYWTKDRDVRNSALAAIFRLKRRSVTPPPRKLRNLRRTNSLPNRDTNDVHRRLRTASSDAVHRERTKESAEHYERSWPNRTAATRRRRPRARPTVRRVTRWTISSASLNILDGSFGRRSGLETTHRVDRDGDPMALRCSRLMGLRTEKDGGFVENVETTARTLDRKWRNVPKVPHVRLKLWQRW